MPRMLPTQLSENTQSPAERRLYSLLSRMQETEDWTVLHSVGIAKHSTQSQGEADFVIVIPSKGVFVLEVKGGVVSQENGRWFSCDRDGINHPIKNPYGEANQAMHSLKEYAAVHSTDDQKTLYGFGVVFPDVTIHGSLSFPDLADEQIADCDDCLNPDSFKAYIEKLAVFWKKRQTIQILPLSHKQAKEIVNLFRPEFKGRKTIASRIRSVEQQLISLTDNQIDCFNTLLENERCIVKGSAGTGKTVIALEYARQIFVEGYDVALFCYNLQLAEYLNINKGNAGIICGSFTEYMEDIARKGEKDIPSSDQKNEEYYKQILPRLFMEAFIELEMAPLDVLILDEAQDLMNEQYIEAFDLILRDGLADGKWFFFMDAEKQNLYHSFITYEEVKTTLKKRGVFFAVSSLTENCRNSLSIIKKIDSIFGTKTRHKERDEEGPDVEVRTYKNILKQEESLNDILQTLEKEGIKKSDIVILSPVRFEKSIAGQFTEIVSNQKKQGYIYFSTIHSFKGMESPVVILSDIESFEFETQKNLLYVGMSRAKTMLYILIKKEAVHQMEIFRKGEADGHGNEEKICKNSGGL